jgi:hypothetical protein
MTSCLRVFFVTLLFSGFRSLSKGIRTGRVFRAVFLRLPSLIMFCDALAHNPVPASVSADVLYPELKAS